MLIYFLQYFVSTTFIFILRLIPHCLNYITLWQRFSLGMIYCRGQLAMLGNMNLHFSLQSTSLEHILFNYSLRDLSVCSVRKPYTRASIRSLFRVVTSSLPEFLLYWGFILMSITLPSKAFIFFPQPF